MPIRCLFKRRTSKSILCPGICPIAERMHQSEICITDICKYPNTEKDIYEFVEAVEKYIEVYPDIN